MSTPAGWYAQPEGQQSYWDGRQWTHRWVPGVGSVPWEDNEASSEQGAEQPAESPNPPLPPQTEKSQPKNWLALIGLLVVGYFAWQMFGGGATHTVTHTVTYTVTGSAQSADTTYQSETGDAAQDGNVSLPYTKTISVKSGSFLYISAQNQGQSGDLTCTITVDGSEIKSTTSTGGFSICTASDRL